MERTCNPDRTGVYFRLKRRVVPDVIAVVMLRMNIDEQVAALVEEYRDRCLWFLRPNYLPTTPEETRRVLELIERYGDRACFDRAEEIKTWLSPPSRATS